MRWNAVFFDIYQQMQSQFGDRLRVYRYLEQEKGDAIVMGGNTMLVGFDYLRYDFDEVAFKDVYSAVLDLTLFLPHLRFDRDKVDSFHYTAVADEVVSFLRERCFSYYRDGYRLVFDHLYRQRDEYGYTSLSKGLSLKLRGTDIFHVICKVAWVEDAILEPKGGTGVGFMRVGRSYALAGDLAESLTLRPEGSFLVGGGLRFDEGDGTMDVGAADGAELVEQPVDLDAVLDGFLANLNDY